MCSNCSVGIWLDWHTHMWQPKITHNSLYVLLLFNFSFVDCIIVFCEHLWVFFPYIVYMVYFGSHATTNVEHVKVGPHVHTCTMSDVKSVLTERPVDRRNQSNWRGRLVYVDRKGKRWRRGCNHDSVRLSIDTLSIILSSLTTYQTLSTDALTLNVNTSEAEIWHSWHFLNLK